MFNRKNKGLKRIRDRIRLKRRYLIGDSPDIEFIDYLGDVDGFVKAINDKFGTKLLITDRKEVISFLEEKITDKELLNLIGDTIEKIREERGYY